MLITSFKTVIHAQVDTIWHLLLDRVEHPQQYDSDVQDVHITERFANGVIREIHMNGSLIRERIEVEDERWTIHSKLLEHPEYAGTIDTKLLNTSVQNPMAPVHLDVSVRLEVKDDHRDGLVKPDRLLEERFNRELERIRAKAEELERYA